MMDSKIKCGMVSFTGLSQVKSVEQMRQKELKENKIETAIKSVIAATVVCSSADIAKRYPKGLINAVGFFKKKMPKVIVDKAVHFNKVIPKAPKSLLKRIGQFIKTHPMALAIGLTGILAARFVLKGAKKAEKINQRYDEQIKFCSTSA